MPIRTPSNILELIGNTPLVPIRRLNPNKGVTILAKLEAMNPGGSIKDRIALSMIERAEERGDLSRDRTIVEASSGNTGIGLAMVAAVKGYRCLIAMSESASVERRQIMRAYGAEILLTPAKLGTDGAIEAVYKLIREVPDAYFCTDQFNNPDNWRAHYEQTAPEIWEQTEGQVDVVVSAMGTTGTLMGLTRRFRELNPRVRLVGVEPYLNHRIQGLKNMKESYRPGIFDKHLPDAIENIHDEVAFEWTKRLAREEGIFVGMSSGAAFAVALAEAAKLESGVVVVIFPDGGERYLSTGLFSAPEKKSASTASALRFTNTLTRRKEAFEPLAPQKVGIYSCGPTAYEYAHLGLCRRVVFADVLRRVLETQDYAVTHVMNITDLDDKTIRAAIEHQMHLEDLTNHYTGAFLDDLTALRVKPASIYPKASEHVGEMIDLAQKLIDAGYAYVKHGSVYFDISKLNLYGQLSKVDLAGIDIGRTVDLDDYEKDSPVDFTLFKRVTLDELKRGIGYETTWGQVRPGWHIECVAMSMKYLGAYFDIHTSGCDLIFPHHENEMAMAQALTGQTLARYWLHSELVLRHGKKMSRSSGNVVTFRDLLAQGYTGRQVRYFLLRTHYRTPLHFSAKNLEEAARALRRVDHFIEKLQTIAARTEKGAGRAAGAFAEDVAEFDMNFQEAINDDLNVARALGSLFATIRRLNPVVSSGALSTEDAGLLLEKLEGMDRVLGILDISSSPATRSEEVERLIAEREEARQAQDWPRADALRARLAAMGVTLMDTAQGCRWHWAKDQ